MNWRKNTHPSGMLSLKSVSCLIGTLALLLLSAAADAGASVDARDYPGPAWSPYLVGAAVGVLSWLTFYFSDKPIGASSFYAHLAGFLGKLIAPRHTGALTYFKEKPPSVGWEFVFVISIICGGAIAAVTGGEVTDEWLPAMWIARFGDSIILRAVVAFAGGMLMAFGARLAGGCTSGHGISGTLQFNLASWISVICFFIGGIAVAIPLYTW
ncbi:MAG: YeeE/YedE thiosulfate transporter family protein [Desulfuromonadaceae bacterium]